MTRNPWFVSARALVLHGPRPAGSLTLRRRWPIIAAAILGLLMVDARPPNACKASAPPSWDASDRAPGKGL